jgi:ribosomal protein L29
MQMNEREKQLITLRRKYLNLRYKIESYEMARNEPPPELIDKARMIGRMAEIPEEELNSLPN